MRARSSLRCTKTARLYSPTGRPCFQATMMAKTRNAYEADAWYSASGGRYYRVSARTRHEVYNIVTDACDAEGGWEELPSGLGLGTTWNLLWTWGRPKVDYSSLLAWQRVNHFPLSRAPLTQGYAQKNLRGCRQRAASLRKHSTSCR